MAGPTLWYQSGDTRDAYRLRIGRQVLGRGHDTDVDLHLDSDQISLRHVELRWHDGVLTISDLGSDTGTSVNGTAISEPTILLDGDVVGLGSIDLQVEIEPEVWIDESPDRPLPIAHRSSLSFASMGRPRGSGRVFIIRHHRDGTLASRLHRTLDRAGWTPWMADAEILGGTDWANQTIEGLEGSAAAVVLLTSRSVRSEWVARQVAQAVRSHVPILTVVVAGAVPVGDLLADLELSERVEVASAAGADLSSVEASLARMTNARPLGPRAARARRIGRILIGAGGAGALLALLLLAAAGRPVDDPAELADLPRGLPAAAEPGGPATDEPTDEPVDDDRAGPDEPVDDDRTSEDDRASDDEASEGAGGGSGTSDGGSLVGSGGFPLLAVSVVAAAVGEALRRGVGFARP